MKKAAATTDRRGRIRAAVEVVFLLLLLAGVALLLREGYRRYMKAAYPLKYTELVQTWADEYDIPQSLVYAVIRTESAFDPDAVSWADARGLMQLTADTLDWAKSKAGDKEELTAEDLFRPEINIRYGVYVLKLLGEQFKEEDTVLAAYNAGMGNVRKWLADPAYSDDGVVLKDIPFKETREYVGRVRDAQAMYQELYDLP